MAIELNKAALRYCTINGVNVLPLPHQLRIYESMCKPYITAELTCLSPDGEMNAFLNGIQVGDEVLFELIDQTAARPYRLVSYVTAIPEKIAGGIRQEMVSIVTATIAYFKDRVQTVQASTVNEPATTFAQRIHNTYIQTPLDPPIPSNGYLVKDTGGGFPVAAEKPFKAIRDALARTYHAQYPAGAVVYFEQHPPGGQPKHQMNPIEYYLTLPPIGDVFAQRDTFGTQIGHQFGTENADNAIIAAKLYARETDGTGKPIPKQSAASITTAAQSVQLYSTFERAERERYPVESFGALSRFAGRNSGLPIMMSWDKARNELQHDPALKIAAENALKADVRDRTNFLVKVGLQAGLKTTVGYTVNMILLAGNNRLIRDTFICADVMHEAYFDKRVVQGTTVIRAVKTTPDRLNVS